jgi:hypothetical protein
MKTGPLFYAFDTKKKPGKMICHGICFETIELDSNDGAVDAVKFQLLAPVNVPSGIDVESFVYAVKHNFPS